MTWHGKYLTASAGAQVICWDLDSSVRSTLHRRPMIAEIRAGRKTWDEYSLRCYDDQPIEGAVTLMRLLSRDYLNIAVSGASSAAEELTVKWCSQHKVPLDDFILRPEGNHMPNGKWKVEGVRKLRAAGLNVVLFVEDWADAAAYIREHAQVPVLGVNPFDPGTALVSQDQLAVALETVLLTDREGAARVAGSLFEQLSGAW